MRVGKLRPEEQKGLGCPGAESERAKHQSEREWCVASCALAVLRVIQFHLTPVQPVC